MSIPIEKTEWLTIKKSTIQNAGKGVFALIDFNKGETVHICSVIEVPKGVGNGYVFGKGSKTYIALDKGSLFNHSSNENIKYYFDKNELVFVALRKIKKGEELFINYGDYYDYEKINNMTGNNQDKVISGIAKVIVNNRKELIAKLVELNLACSCVIEEATEKDLSDVVVENIENKDLQKWLAQKIAANAEYKNAGADPVTAIANAIGAIFSTVTTGISASAAKKAQKEAYKNAITQKALDYKIAQEKAKTAERTTNTLMIVGGSLLLIGVGFAIYYGTKPKAQLAV